MIDYAAFMQENLSEEQSLYPQDNQFKIEAFVGSKFLLIGFNEPLLI